MRFFTPLCRRLYGFLALFLVVFHAWPHAVRSEWNKDRLYRVVLAGDAQQRLAAARQLVDLDAPEQLMRALQSDSGSVRMVAASALFDLWIREGGPEAGFILQVAADSWERKNLKGALNHLTLLTEHHPFFAEGWNRRASLLCQLGEFERALADCKKVVLLNPDHFAGWQALGLCQGRLGDYEAARRSFQQAVRIVPHDRQARQFLNACEEMLRRSKQPPSRVPTRGELV